MKKLPLPQLALEDRVDPAVLEAPVKTEMTCLTKNYNGNNNNRNAAECNWM